MELKTSAFPRLDKRTREVLRFAVNRPIVPKSKKERALEAKDQERRPKKVGTIITATKETLLQARQFRDELANDPRFMERQERRLGLPSSRDMPCSIRQYALMDIVNNALAGTPEGDILDDWESSFVVLPENCVDEVLEEINVIVGREYVEEAHAQVLRMLESEGEDEDADDEGDEDGSDEEMAEVEHGGV